MSFTDFLETETLGKTTYNKINFNHRSIDKTKVKFLWYISDQKKKFTKLINEDPKHIILNIEINVS